MVNGVFYTMEMRFLLFGELNLTVGELGPVEIEWLTATGLIMTGYLGPECMQASFGDAIGIKALSGVQVNAAIGCIIIPLVAMFWYENLGDCLSKEPRKSFWYLLPVLEMSSLYILSTYTPMYLTQRTHLLLLFNFILASITLELMLCNMAKRHFKQFHLPLLFGALPVLSHYLGLSDEFNQTLVQGALFSSAMYFYTQMAIVCKQFVDHTGMSFFIRKVNHA